MNSSISIPYSRNLFNLVKGIPFQAIAHKYSPTEIRRKGRYFIALCPFHPEKTPSFYVFENGFHCFGCGAHGDGVAYVSKILGIRPYEAARQIAVDFGISVVLISPKAQRKLNEIERERKLQSAFKEWERATFARLVGFRDTVRDVFRSDGFNADDSILTIIRDYMPRIEHWIEILSVGSPEDKIALFKSGVV